MISREPTIIQSDNISVAWARAFLALLKPGVDELIPLVVNLARFPHGVPVEIPEIRRALDARLATDEKMCPTATTANLIFPEKLWERYRDQGRDVFFRRYLDVISPRLKQADRRNSKGTYFERLLSYGPNRINQLAHVINTRLSGNRRRSALQVMVFDPVLDHSNSRYLGFPCLDHLTFAPDHHGALSLTAFYANHYIYDRAYGNYLGLCALGRFVARELGLEFGQLTCVSGVATCGRGSMTKANARELGDMISAALPGTPNDRTAGTQDNG